MKTLNPVPSPHAEAAKVLIDKIRSLRDDLPRFIPERHGQPRRLGASSRVTDAMLESTSVAVERSSRLEVAAGTDAASLRDSSAYVLAYTQVIKELVAMTRAVAHTVRTERARAGLSALDIYAIATRLAKHDDGAELLAYVLDFRKSLKTKRPRKTNSASDSAPVVTPAPSPK